MCILGSRIVKELKAETATLSIAYDSADVACLRVNAQPHVFEHLSISTQRESQWSYRLAPLFMKIDGSVVEHVQARQLKGGASGETAPNQASISFEEGSDKR